MDATLNRLSRQAYSVKKRFLNMYHQAHAGHIGCALSCAEILVFLKFGWMREGDELLLSKGHAAAALYSVLAEAGLLSDLEIQTYYRNGTFLAAHPSGGKIPGISFGTGSLGHGLSLCAGMALGSKIKKQDKKIFCVTSDGELDEGSTWEAALFLSQNKLNHVTWVIDRNGIQGIGRTEEVMALEPLEEKLKAFGFCVTHADGHDFKSLLAAKEKCLQNSVEDRPNVIICKTVKGHGVSFMENTVDCHYLPMSSEQYGKAMAELESSYRGVWGDS